MWPSLIVVTSACATLARSEHSATQSRIPTYKPILDSARFTVALVTMRPLLAKLVRRNPLPAAPPTVRGSLTSGQAGRPRAPSPAPPLPGRQKFRTPRAQQQEGSSPAHTGGLQD